MRQHGNVTRAQLRGLGISDQGIKHRIAVGRLHRVHRGVYAVGRPPVVVLERAAAAVLACGPGAALSHASALALWGITPWPRRFDVIVTRRRRPRGITVHRCALARRDLATQRGIRVTTAARALLDSATRLNDDDLTRAVNDARHKRLTSPQSLAELLERYPNHFGVHRLRPFADAGSPLTLSKMEDRFASFCARYDLPTPAFNVMVCGYMVDALFAEERLIVELDSWEFHQDRHAFKNDRRRDAVTLAAGYATVRITWERLDAAEAERLSRILHARRA
jgi:predicted transcriptional regulator of viral defense system